MSTVLNGVVIDTELSRNARGGTEQMRSRLLKYIPSELLQGVAIHFSRPRKLYPGVKNIFYAHDLSSDPENKILEDQVFDHFVFVSHWQRDSYISKFCIPYSKCTVIENAIEKEYSPKEKSIDKIKFIYHTTPHRGLELLYPIFLALCNDFDNIYLDVYSSFEIYGWQQRDKAYSMLFEKLRSHPKIAYHGTKSNAEVLDALNDAHIFLYPCVWQETSCIAMIEAIRSGCIVIHPNYAALSETANSATMMYDYTENISDHANKAYQITKQILTIQSKQDSFINKYVVNTDCRLPKHSIDVFTAKWNLVLEHVKNE